METPHDANTNPPRGAGWIGFAGILLTLVGVFNIIDGIAAISDSKYVHATLLFSNLHTWGWFFLIFGAVQVFAGLAIFAGAKWAAMVGIITAFFNCIAQLSASGMNTTWTICAIVCDVLVIYGLVVYGGDDGSEPS